MSQLRVYETSHPAAAATAAVLSNNSNPFVSLPLHHTPFHSTTPPPVSFLRLNPVPSSSHSFCLYTFISTLSRTRTHARVGGSLSVFSRTPPPCVQTIRNIKPISPRAYSFNYLNTHIYTARRVVYQSNLISVFKCVSDFQPSHRPCQRRFL
jgi:hypothetical protein